VPELPEVETTRRFLERRIVGERIAAVSVHRRMLRVPVDAEIARRLPGASVLSVGRRGKYLVIGTDRGAAISHLGMSGRWSIVPAGLAREEHDHVDLLLAGGEMLRYRDPRRFGSLLWGGGAPAGHASLAALGPEPWGEAGPEEIGDHLWREARGRRAPLRNLLIDGRVVAGVGNIYASEAAHRAGIRPGRPAGRISRARYRALASALAQVLAEAIERGGTTLRDYADPGGREGGFGGRCLVYGREGEPCRSCGRAVVRVVIAARSAYYCPGCQR